MKARENHSREWVMRVVNGVVARFGYTVDDLRWMTVRQVLKMAENYGGVVYWDHFSNSDLNWIL